jgi:hypothetical protein
MTRVAPREDVVLSAMSRIKEAQVLACLVGAGAVLPQRLAPKPLMTNFIALGYN